MNRKVALYLSNTFDSNVIKPEADLAERVKYQHDENDLYFQRKSLELASLK